ncbi:MAG: UDP-N-acetylmuramoyl-L-alanyl-D-glutamate--2,6-diaminopimelate ligase [Candidatus Nomurabacteria bacterium]|nr:UDP-N-acetylmuramoyl-L-alanyl-D-glutamate--2,6-diaminopimelate ligase [Candidatus Nomurabacteria bacterium]
MKKLKTIWWAVKLFFTRIQYGNPSKKLKIIGVTGTNGKTTVATLLYKIATALGHKSGLIGTVEILIEEEKFKTDSGKPIPATTPDSVFLTKLFAKMIKAGCEYVFMEVSSHALDQKRVAGVNFTGGIFTNLTHDHLDYHKDLENYFKAKKKFFEMLPKNAFALSNMDDEHGNAMLDDIKAEKFFYSFPEAQLRGVSPKLGFGEGFYGKILKSDFSGLELDFNGEKIHSKLLGKFNAYNLLAVWATLRLLNFNIKEVNKILENIEAPRGRFEHFISKNGISIIVDYAHSPDALEKVLLTIKEIKSKNSRIISVFGCGGDRDTSKRPKMGKIGASLSDIAIFTSDNPRSENPDKIIEVMKDNLSHEEAKKIITISDRRLAIEEAVELAKEGDIILCAGKGHEEYQEIKSVKSHFNDIEEFKKVLK